eukprot:140187_1
MAQFSCFSSVSCMSKQTSVVLILLIVPLLSVDVFKGGVEGYFCYRIPSLLLTSNGTLIAFTEGRKYNCKDHGYVDIVYKRSYDNGITWSNLSIFYSNSTSSTSFNTIGNPSPVQSSIDGKIWMIFCKNNLEIWAAYSIDDGATFSHPKILNTVNNPLWVWVATGPPSGLEITVNNKQRLIFPLDWSIIDEYYTKGYVVYTDDNGETFQISKEFGDDNWWPNESQAVQLNNGSVFINSRTCKNDTYYRLGSISNDGGQTFVETHYIKELRNTAGTGCEGSMIMASNGNIYYSGLTPSAITANRINMTLHFSKDQGNSWQFMTVIEPGSSAYSSLVEIKSKNSIAVLYGRDNQKYISFDTYSI